MKKLSEDLIIKIKNLRKEGNTVKDIAKQLQISSATSSFYCKGVIPSYQKLEENLKSKRLEISKKAGDASRKKSQDNRKNWFEKGINESLSILDSLFVGCYWGEGCKTKRAFMFTNSDPEMIKLCFIWLKNNNIEQIKLSIQCHPEDDAKIIKNFWQDYLNYQQDFPIYKVRSKTSSQKIKRKTIYGTARVCCKGSVNMFEFLDGKKTKILKELNIIS